MAFVRTSGFTDHLEFSGHPGYYNGLPPAGASNMNAPSTRAGTLPPVVEPRRGAWGWTKTAVPPAVVPGAIWGVRGQTGNTLGR